MQTNTNQIIDPVIKVKDLTKKFGNFTAVDHISFEVGKGEIFGFLGANGAGKTTAIRMLCGLSYPTSGTATVDSYNVATDAADVKRHIGYMSQKFSLYSDLTVGENMTLFGGIYGMSRKDIKLRSEELLCELGMTDQRKTRVSILPLGWKQRLAFAIAIFHRPAVVFLDEPTGGVDPITRREFWEQIVKTSQQGTTMFVTTHYMDEVEYCHRASIMVDGRIAALNTPAALKQEFGGVTMYDVFYALARRATRT